MINKPFEDQITTVAAELVENSKKYCEILSIHHTDADGISSGKIIRLMLTRMKIAFRQQANPLKESWENYLNSIESTCHGPMGIIFSDLSPAPKEIISFANKHPEIDFYILDHHIFQQGPDELPYNIYLCNPTQFGLNGLKEICGAVLNYLFAIGVDDKNTALCQYAVVGMGGDVLDHVNDYRSYNLQVINDAADLGFIEIKSGLCAFGGMHETLAKGLAMSLLPFITQVEGNAQKAESLIQSLGIEPRTPIETIDPADIQTIIDNLDARLAGDYAIFQKKEGILRFAFEHAQLISFIGFDRSEEAMQLLDQRKISAALKKEYNTDLQNIIHNLATFVQLPKIETNHAIIVDMSGRIEPKGWSDTASYANLNQIIDPQKALLLGGIDEERMKLSVRCSDTFLQNHHNQGANRIVVSLNEILGSDGGGHPLAAGIRIQPDQFEQLTGLVDQIIDAL